MLTKRVGTLVCVGFWLLAKHLLYNLFRSLPCGGASRGGVLEKVLLFDPRFVLHAVSHGHLSPFCRWRRQNGGFDEDCSAINTGVTLYLFNRSNQTTSWPIRTKIVGNKDRIQDISASRYRSQTNASIVMHSK